MAKLDPFSAQIVQLVREMPDEAILELVRNKLGAEDDEATEVTPSPRRTAPKKAAAKKTRAKRGKKKATKKRTTKKAASKAKTGTAKKATTKKATKKASPKKTAKKRGKKKTGKRGGDRQREMDAVERVIKASKGLSASEIVKRTKLPRARVSAAVRALKDARRIHQGGDRRFARYAGDAKTAKAASEEARRTASGPSRK